MRPLDKSARRDYTGGEVNLARGGAGRCGAKLLSGVSCVPPTPYQAATGPRGP